LVTAEFAFNNKVHTVTKTSPFQVNYGKESRMGFDIRKKEKNEKAKLTEKLIGPYVVKKIVS